MNNTVMMSLKDYDRLKEDINYLENKIAKMKEDRVKELKEIFKLHHFTSDIGLKIDYEKIIKEIYGEEIKIDDARYVINKGKDLIEPVYYIWHLEEEED